MTTDHKPNLSNKTTEISLSIKEVFLLLKKRIWLLLGIILLALIITVFINFISKPYYSTNFVIKSHLISTNQTSLLIQDLKLLIQDNNLKRFCKLLNLKIDEAHNIILLDTRPLKEEGNVLLLLVNTYKPADLMKFSDGIIFYLNNNKYVQNELSTEIEYQKSLLYEVESEIVELEKTKNIIQELYKDPMTSQLPNFSPSELTEALLNLKDQRLIAQKKISGLIGFEIIKEPFIPSNPVWPNKIKNFVFAICISLVVGVFLVLFLETFRK